MFFRIGGLIALVFAQFSSNAFAENQNFDEVTMADLASFEYTPEAPEEDGKIIREDETYLTAIVPENIRSLNKRSIMVTGYMMPLDAKDGMVKEFLLLPNTMLCCYGMAPAYNEFIYVKMSGEAAPALENVPLTLYGQLTIAENWQDGLFAHLYEIRGVNVEIARFN